MRPDLMRVASVGSGFDQAIGIVLADQAKMCRRRASFDLVDHRPMAAVAVGSEGQVDHFILPTRDPGTKSVINLYNSAFGKLTVQAAVGIGCAAEEHNPAGIFIQPVDDEKFSPFRL